MIGRLDTSRSDRLLPGSNQQQPQAGKKTQRERLMKAFLLTLVLALSMHSLALAAVNVNTATKEELTSINGIGEKRAQDIIDYRTKNGAFRSVDDLEKVPGIGPGLMKRIRSQITVDGKTTSPAAGETKIKGGDAKKSGKADENKPAVK
jgi:competence protein ComEA